MRIEHGGRAAAAGAAALAGWVALGRFLPSGAPLGVVLQGMVFGSVTALQAMALILVYRANRIINFASAGMGGVGGVLAVHLYLSRHWPYPLAVAVALLTGLATGAAVELLVIRRFVRSSRLVLTVATIGLAQVLGGIELVIPRWFRSSGLIGGFRTPLTAGFDVGPVRITGDHLLIVTAVPLVAAGLAWFLLRTGAGVAVRAGAENRDRALLLGIPVHRLVTVVWVVAGGLAGLTAILQAPFAGSVSTAMGGPQVLLPALAAAVVARMESLPRAFVAGLGLGVLQQLVFWNTSRASTTDLAVLVVILGALVLQRRRLQRADDGEAATWSLVETVRPVPLELRRLPEVRVARIGLLLAVATVAVLLPAALSPRGLNLATVALLWGMTAVSIVVLTGWGGNVSLGQFAIVGVGAVVAGNVLVRWHVDLFVTLAVAGLAGGVIALLLGVPALRIRGMFLAVTTLAFAVALDSYFLNPVNFAQLIQESVHRPFLWQRFDTEQPLVMYELCLVFLVLTVVVVRNVRATRTGRALVATRENERAAAAAGVATTALKLTGFVFSGVVAGVTGGLYVLLLHGSRVGTFQPGLSIEVFSMAVIGGLGSIGGALAGVFAFRWLAQVLTGELRMMVTGAGLLVVLMVVPGGVAQVLLGLRDRLLRRVAERRGLTVPSLLADRGPALSVVEPPVATGSAGTADAPLLRCRGVDVAYGSVQVLFGVDLEVAEGELVALLGTNGAGKSTLLRTVSGLVRPTAGTIELAGEDITRVPAHQVVTRGVAQMPGGKGVFPTLTVADNLRLAQWLDRHDHDAADAALEQVLAMLPALRRRYRQVAGNLSGGEQQMLALGQSLMRRPRLLLIDELSLGLAPAVVGELIEVVERAHESGVTVIVVEQSVNVALHLARRAVFMEKGEVRFQGPTDALLERPDLLRSVFITGSTAPPVRRVRRRRGAAAPALAGDPASTDAAVVLECVEVSRHFGGIRAVDRVDLRLHEGEVLGLIGQNGAGKTTLFDCVSGFLPIDGGRILLRGRDVATWAPHERASEGLGRSFQNARLYPSLTVAETVAVALERHLGNRDLVAGGLQLPASAVSESAAGARVAELIELLGLEAYREKLVGELSTGTRRIVDLACLLAHDPDVVLLDEPSAGLAQRETEALGPLLLRVRGHTGCAMIVIEHDMPLLRSICHRLIALELGQVIAEGTPDEVLAHPRVVRSYLGTNEVSILRSGSGAATVSR